MTILKFIKLATIFVLFPIISFAQQDSSLVDLPQSQREKILTEIAKETFKKQMPEIYRDYGIPTFRKIEITRIPRPYEESSYGEKKGDIFYIVTFPRDSIHEKELFSEYAARIWIWADIRKAFAIDYGHLDGVGEVIYKREKRD